MLEELKYVFAVALHQKLKQRIAGRIFVKVIYGDRLYIKIESYGGLVYESYVDNFTEKALNGLNSEYVAYEIANEFKKVVLNKYFI